MKAKRLLDAIAQDLSSVSLSLEFPANVAKLKLLARNTNFAARAQRLLRMVEQRELSDLITAIRSGLSSGKLHKGTAELRGFLKLLPQYEKRMIRERPQCFAEAKLLLHDLQNQGFAKNPVNSKRPFVLYPTLEDHEGRRPMLIFGGAFEMNRKRH